MSVRIAAGEFKGRKVRTVTGPGYRPAMQKVRQAEFSMLEARGIEWEHIRVLDLFAGSGSLGLEAMSRGCREVWFVESSRRAVQALQETVSDFRIPPERYKVVSGKVEAFLRRPPAHPFDLVFVDPPYGRNFLVSTLQALLAKGWLSGMGMIAAEVEGDIETAPVGGLEEIVNRTYGYTRIFIWSVQSRKQQSIQEPSTL